MSDKPLHEQVRDHLSRDPSKASLYLEAVTHGLKDYENSVKKQRDTEAWLALEMLSYRVMSKKLTARQRCIFSIRSIAYLFSRGFASANSDLLRSYLVEFCKDYFGTCTTEPKEMLHGSKWEIDTVRLHEQMAMIREQWVKQPEFEER